MEQILKTEMNTAKVRQLTCSSTGITLGVGAWVFHTVCMTLIRHVNIFYKLR